MAETLSIESTSVVPIRVAVTSENDPGVNTPEFQLTATTENDPTGTWVAGTWDGTWSATTGTGLIAITPPTNSTDFELSGTKKLWIRWVAGTHTPVFAVGKVKAA